MACRVCREDSVTSANLQTKLSLYQSIAKVNSSIGWDPFVRTAQSAVHFNPWQTCSVQHLLDFSGMHCA